jgi:CheY-like chemotaxis protein
VLLVEDDADASLLTARRLESSDLASFEVNHETTLGGALRCLEEESFDAIVLDLGLPDGGCLSTVAGTLLFARHLPIVILTTSRDERLAQKARASGFADYLIKEEQDNRSLAVAILRAVNDRRSQSPAGG